MVCVYKHGHIFAVHVLKCESITAETIILIIAISVLLAATKCTKFVFGQGSAPDPARGDHDAPPDHLVGWGEGHPVPISPSAPTGLDSHAFSVRLGGFLLIYITSIPQILISLLAVITLLYFCNVQNNSESEQLQCLMKQIKQIVAISVLLAATKCTKFVFGRGSAPDPAGKAHDAPQTP